MNTIDYAARVAKGAALLDDKRPGWERLIDLSTLDIAPALHCVTAQLDAARHATGAWRLGLELDAYVLHGFQLEAGVPSRRSPYATLNTLWRDLITARLAAPKADA